MGETLSDFSVLKGLRIFVYSVKQPKSIAMQQSSDYIDFILDKFSSLDVVSARKMFGGYVLHMAGKVLGFVFDGTFLFEPGPTVDRILPDAERRELFPGSKLFVVIDESFSSRRLCELAQACYDDLPLPKPRKRKSQTKVSENKRQKEIEKTWWPHK